MDIDSIIENTTPATASATVCMSGELLAEYDDLVAELNQLGQWKSSSLSDVDPRIPIRERLNELHEQMRGSSVKFTFRAIGDRASSDLLAKHPSPKNDQGQEEYAFDPQSYPAALVAAASVEPVMTEEQAGRLFDKLNLSQRNAIFGAAFRANNRQVDVPFFEAASEPAASTE